MKRRLGVIISIILLVIFVAIVAVAGSYKKPPTLDYQSVVDLAKTVNYGGYDTDAILPADANSGDIPEKVIGNPAAPVLVFEYADYACSHCAEANRIINELVSAYDGQVAVVFRSYLLSYFSNNVPIAAAATAAQLQGYWKEYKDLLFENQSTWYSLEDDNLRTYLGELFEEASAGQGQLEQFYQDFDSQNIIKRIAFEYGLGSQVGISGTPTFRLGGKSMSISELPAAIDQILQTK